MTILIFEPNLSGHRSNYLWLSAKLFVQNGHRAVLLTLKENEGNRLLQQTKEKLGTGFSVHFGVQHKFERKLYAGKKLYNKEFLNYLLIKKFLKSSNRPEQINLIFFPYLDAIARFLSLTTIPFGGIPFTGISMVPAFHYQRMGINAPKPRLAPLGKILFLKLLKNRYLTTLLTIDQPLHEYIQRFHPKHAAKVRYIPDPVEMPGKSSKAAARAHFGIPDDVRVILVFGSIAERKGVLELLSAVFGKEKFDDLAVLVAGVQTGEVRSKIQAMGDWRQLIGQKIFIIDRYLDTEEEYMAFKASDVVWCGYKGFFAMSAVLVQAAAMGLPVVACQKGIAGWLTEKYETGKTIDVNSEKAIQQAIKSLMNNKEEYARLSQNGKTLSKMHKEVRFNEVLKETLKISIAHSSCGKPYQS